MVEAVLFDCFGTLVELDPKAYFANQRSRAFDLLKTQKAELTYDSFHKAWKSTFSSMEAESRQTQDEFSMAEFAARVQKSLDTHVANDMLVEAYLDEWVLGLSAIDGLSESLHRIRQHKKIAIVSNTHYAPLIQRALSVASIDPAVFDKIVTSIDVGKQKPHPAMMQVVLSELGVTPANAVMVGDSYREDFGIAKATGTRCLLVASKELPDASFEPGHCMPINTVLDVEDALLKLSLD